MNGDGGRIRDSSAARRTCLRRRCRRCSSIERCSNPAAARCRTRTCARRLRNAFPGPAARRWSPMPSCSSPPACRRCIFRSRRRRSHRCCVARSMPPFGLSPRRSVLGAGGSAVRCTFAPPSPDRRSSIRRCSSRPAATPCRHTSEPHPAGSSSRYSIRCPSHSRRCVHQLPCRRPCRSRRRRVLARPAPQRRFDPSGLRFHPRPEFRRDFRPPSRRKARLLARSAGPRRRPRRDPGRSRRSRWGSHCRPVETSCRSNRCRPRKRARRPRPLRQSGGCSIRSALMERASST